MDKKRIVPISTPYLTLGQLLKLVNIIGNGGEAKSYLATHEVKVNGEPDNRRGRKLYPGDEILVAGQAFAIGQ